MDYIIENICRVICDATFEPVVVCDDWRPLACNQRLIEVFKYKKEAEIVCQPIQDFMRKHFTPKEVFEKGQNRQVKIADLTYAMVSNSDMSEKMAIVKTKEWHFENRTYYTISIRDVPILKFAQKEWMPIETENNPMRNMVSDINEPQLESRLLSEFALLADAIPVMVWICGREGEIYYANRRVKETWGIDVLSEPWDQNIHPEDWEQFVPLWQDASKSLTPFKMEARYRNKQTPIIAGDETGWRWHIFQSIPVFRNGELKRWVLTAVGKALFYHIQQ
ncbi:hypothetical protein K502DRAFT_323046 [Neoconidiobolus thromboides FSU 785]|nr:hypothetical protein K502DRAFT_323046 [Neoconidiobolus thromboides FSU 785]